LLFDVVVFHRVMAIYVTMKSRRMPNTVIISAVLVQPVHREA